MDIRFIKNKRALIVGDFIVISDLHFGYEKEIKGYVIPNQRKRFIRKIKEIGKKFKKKKLVILGDVKHKIPFISINEKFEISKFFDELSKEFKEIIIIKGNHDGKIENLINQKNVRVLKEFIVNSIAFIHGHRRLSKDAVNCKIIVMGHVHPTFKVKDKTGTVYRYPCWIIGKLNNAKVIVVPSFNELTIGYENLSGPLSKEIREKEVFLLDLTKVS